jgi:hypothetical protein
VYLIASEVFPTCLARNQSRLKGKMEQEGTELALAEAETASEQKIRIQKLIWKLGNWLGEQLGASQRKFEKKTWLHGVERKP